ncbi:MAG: PRC-barrel domain-containing protein [Methanophagales archaeon]|nr:PRC-barrel domain-containing protein [Methanophagales archaeon]MCW3139619.1 PRC-barrel domain-containing protein [Methanophagales archaeon]MCW7070179.1 PRC-barrel domain-containing protein [Methanophagales archaeon]MCW7073312.1 PRC-barrel domain-containing protein [Methanophagales archaeon]
MRKARARGDEEKVIAYMTSRLFPWNFIVEDVDPESLRHFVPYAIQICEDRGIKKGSIERDRVKEVIEKELRWMLNDYLHQENGDVTRAHGKFYAQYPFAFAQALIHTILYRLGVELEDVVNINALGELLELDIKTIKKKERFIRDLISRNEEKALRIFSKAMLNRKVISEEGDYIGSVSDIVFDSETGILKGLILIQQRGSERLKVPMDDMKLNLYSRNIVLRYIKKEQ